MTTDENDELINTANSENANKTDNITFQDNNSVSAKSNKKRRYSTAIFFNKNRILDNLPLSRRFWRHMRDKYAGYLRYTESVNDFLV